jgi:hypothetical protein
VSMLDLVDNASLEEANIKGKGYVWPIFVGR